MLDDMAQPEKFVEDLQAENATLRKENRRNAQLNETATRAIGSSSKLILDLQAENAKLREALLRANAIICDGLDDYWREQNEGRLLELDAVVEYALAAKEDKP